MVRNQTNTTNDKNNYFIAKDQFSTEIITNLNYLIYLELNYTRTTFVAVAEMPVLIKIQSQPLVKRACMSLRLCSRSSRNLDEL